MDVIDVQDIEDFFFGKRINDGIKVMVGRIQDNYNDDNILNTVLVYVSLVRY